MQTDPDTKSTIKLIGKYLLALGKRWYYVAAAFAELLGMFLLPANGINIPPFIYLIIYGVIFLIANFLVYRDLFTKSHKIEMENKIKIDTVSAKIAELKATHPDLKLLFKDISGELVNNFTIFVGEPPLEPDIESLLEQESKKLIEIYKFIKLNNEIDDEETFLKRKMGSIIDEEAKLGNVEWKKKPEEYSEQSEEYLKKYHEYLVSKFYFDSAKTCQGSASFTIENSGKVPGNKIIIITHFPDIFIFPEDKSFWWEYNNNLPPKPPDPPKSTRSIHDYTRTGLSGYQISSIVTPKNDTIYMPPSDVSGPHITKRNSTEVEYQINELIHNQKKELKKSEFYRYQRSN